MPTTAGPATGESMTVSAAERDTLLDLARRALDAATGRMEPDGLGRALRDAVGCDRPAAVFVTLTEDDELRGCMGSIDASRPVGEAVVDAALAAALGDPRFRPLDADELASLRIDVSVLGPPVAFDDPDRLRPGTDGVIVRRGRAVGLLLPEVAPRLGWGGRELVEAACRKAGLPGAAWRDPETRLATFETAHFGGPAIVQEPSAAQGPGAGTPAPVEDAGAESPAPAEEPAGLQR